MPDDRSCVCRGILSVSNRHLYRFMLEYFLYNFIERSGCVLLMPSSFTKEGDAHEHNGGFNFVAGNFCGTILHR